MSKRNLSALLVLALAAMCFAPIEDKPAGAKFHGELSDAQLAASQGGNMTSSTPAGGSSLKEPGASEVEAAPNDDAAGSVVANAQADQVLKNAETERKDQEAAKTRPFVLGGTVLLGVGALLFGAKLWLDKSVPASGS